MVNDKIYQGNLMDSCLLALALSTVEHEWSNTLNAAPCRLYEAIDQSSLGIGASTRDASGTYRTKR